MKYLVHVPEGNLFLTKEEISAKVGEVLKTCPSEFTCVYRVWYEGFEGCGRPSAEVVNIMNEAMAAAGWTDVGAMRWEKFGVIKPSFKNPNYATAAKEANGVPMILHRFHQGKHYQGPDGRIFWIPVMEIFDLRAFEWKDGKYIGTMVEIDPMSEYAQQMVEVQV